MASQEAAQPAKRASRHQEQVVAEFRANAGKVGGYYSGTSLLLLSTTGARTGRRRATPLAYLADSGWYVIAAANAGARTNPDWYRDLITHPEVTVETGGETFGATATVVTGTTRDALLSRYVAAYPQLTHYQAMTTREIPLVALTGNGDRNWSGPRSAD